jgi:signal transduction histidine kinase
MAQLELATSGKTLGFREGSAPLSRANLPYIVRRAALAGVAIAALVAGLAATVAAVTGVSQTGVVSDPPGGLVTYVSPTGYAWRVGMRIGQTVDVLDSSDAPNGWRMETHDAAGHYTAIGPEADHLLQLTLPFGLAALGTAYLAVLFLRTRRRWVLPAAAVGFLVATVPLIVEGGTDTSTLVMGAAAFVPAAALAMRLPGDRRVNVPLIGAGLVATGIWAVARLSGSDAYPGIEEVRGNVALWGTLLLVIDRTVVPALAGERVHVIRPRLADVGLIAGLAAVALALMLLQAPPFIVALLLIAAMLFLPISRRRFAGPLGEALLGDVREAAAADAAEAERARLARELHDVPMQELAAVIRRLEIVPGAEAESENLRQLASHLRNVATELRPPVLDDLGLGAALDYLAEDASTPAFPVSAVVRDDTGFGPGRRPPAEVELAIFRIAGEAVGNAVRHSGGTKAEISAAVRPDRVDLSVTDDGLGLGNDAAREATRRKRLGMASMRRRAEAIDAELSIESSAKGTEVRLAWRA